MNEGFAQATGKTNASWLEIIKAGRRDLKLAGSVDRPFEWSNQDFYVLATKKFSNIVFVHPSVGSIIIDRWIPYKPTDSNRQFIVFWNNRLVYKRIGSYIHYEKDLPAHLREALSTSSPMSEEDAKKV
jgi:hypothetical protein